MVRSRDVCGERGACFALSPPVAATAATAAATATHAAAIHTAVAVHTAVSVHTAPTAELSIAAVAVRPSSVSVAVRIDRTRDGAVIPTGVLVEAG